MALRVMVNQSKCSSAGIRVKELTEIFRFQPGSKRAEVIVDIVPERFEEQCRKIAEKCPSQAIIMEEC